jgi:hypothetical protein
MHVYAKPCVELQLVGRGVIEEETGRKIGEEDDEEDLGISGR